MNSAGTIDGVIHFAGLKAVGESVTKLLYWDVNVNGSRVLVEAMERNGCEPWFSAAPLPPTGTQNVSATRGHANGAGASLCPDQVAVEQMLAALPLGSWQVACLRYFNPVGAHPSGRIGEDPLGIPNNLFRSSPRWLQDAASAYASLGMTTPHLMAPASGITYVMDLAEARDSALDHLFARHASDPLTLNIGTAVD